MSHCLETTPKLYINSLAFRAIRLLSDHDEKQGSKLIKLLSAYLYSERNATATCNVMHMHRNTVLYNISKIESLLNINLDDNDVRIKLMLGLKAYYIGQF